MEDSTKKKWAKLVPLVRRVLQPDLNLTINHNNLRTRGGSQAGAGVSAVSLICLLLVVRLACFHQI